MIKVIAMAVCNLHTQHSRFGISNRKHEQSWTSCKVSWRMPLKSRTLRSMVGSLAQGEVPGLVVDFPASAYGSGQKPCCVVQ